MISQKIIENLNLCETIIYSSNKIEKSRYKGVIFDKKLS